MKNNVPESIVDAVILAMSKEVWRECFAMVAVCIRVRK